MGKTLKVEMTMNVSEGRIVNVTISGDFFAYPSETLEELELEIRGKTVEEALKIIDGYEGRVKLVGASLQDVKQLIQQAGREKPDRKSPA
ncbi:MAG TPA: hypothetical protein ENF79_01485 [Nitrososphaeria archaeon]|nr:hypothetical protein [Nitrososphaeria archaeon]